MKFLGELDAKQSAHVENCNRHLRDPARLKVLQDTGLMDTPREEVFDRLCRLTAKILNVPLTIVSLVDDTRQFFKADYGLPHPFSETRTLPIDFSLCRYTMAGDSIISSDAEKDPFLKIHPSTGPWGISALIVLPLITPDGHVLGTFCCIQPTPREWTELDIEVMKELTASIMTEINLRNEVAKLKREQNLRDTFIAALTHDLRTPLTVVKISAQLMAKKHADKNDIVLATDKMIHSVERADGMIQNLLDANLLKSGFKLPVNIAECNIISILNEVIAELTILHGDRFKIDCKVEKIKADAVALRRMIENLASNAGKYSEAESTIEISASTEDGVFKFKVKNLGNPISKKDQKTIFEPFQRTVDAAEGTQKGWGLGLPLVRGLAEAHNGRVTVISDAENGTCFLIELPQ